MIAFSIYIIKTRLAGDGHIQILLWAAQNLIYLTSTDSSRQPGHVCDPGVESDPQTGAHFIRGSIVSLGFKRTVDFSVWVWSAPTQSF